MPDRAHLLKLFRFAVVGVGGALIYLAAVFTLHKVLGLALMVSSALGFIIAAVVNYGLHYVWTFRSEKDHRVAFLQYLLVTSCGFGINQAGLYLGTAVLHQSFLPVQLVTIGAITTSNYLLGNFWVFRSRASSAAGAKP